MPNVVREGDYRPPDDTQENPRQLPPVVEHVQAHGECSGPQLCGLLLCELNLGWSFLKLDVLDRGRGHLGGWGYEQSALLVNFNTV